MKARSFPRPSEERKGRARCRRGPAGLGASSSTWGGRRGGGHSEAAGDGAGGQGPAVLTPISLKVCSVLSARLRVGRSGGREIPEGAPSPSHLQPGRGGGTPAARPRLTQTVLLREELLQRARAGCLCGGSGVGARAGGENPDIPPAAGQHSPRGLQRGLGLRGWVLLMCLSFPQSRAGLGWG